MNVGNKMKNKFDCISEILKITFKLNMYFVSFIG